MYIFMYFITRWVTQECWTIYKHTVIGGMCKQLCMVFFSDLDNPTVDCSRDVTYRIAVIAISSVIGLVVVAGAAICLGIVFCSYKGYKQRQKTERRADMHISGKDVLENNQNLHNKLSETLHDKSLTKKEKKIEVKELKKSLNVNRGVFKADGANSDTNDENN